MSKRQRSREEGQCAYCGQHDILTVDHVIPRCLFDGVTGGVPGDAPRVGACLQCNNAKSTDDAFLRDVLIRDLRLAEHPIAQTIRNSAHARSITRGKSQYPRAASRLRFVPSPTGSGLWVAEPILPKERLHGIFTRLVRGLMVAYEHYELASTTNFDVVRAVDTKVAIAEAQRWAADTSGSGMVHTVQAGDGSVFWCVYYHSLTPEHLNLSHWWLRFYEHVVYWVGTDMSNLSLDKF
jgi:hypothetical protein